MHRVNLEHVSSKPEYTRRTRPSLWCFCAHCLAWNNAPIRVQDWRQAGQSKHMSFCHQINVSTCLTDWVRAYGTTTSKTTHPNWSILFKKDYDFMAFISSLSFWSDYPPKQKVEARIRRTSGRPFIDSPKQPCTGRVSERSTSAAASMLVGWTQSRTRFIDRRGTPFSSGNTCTPSQWSATGHIIIHSI